MVWLALVGPLILLQTHPAKYDGKILEHSTTRGLQLKEAFWIRTQHDTRPKNRGTNHQVTTIYIKVDVDPSSVIDIYVTLHPNLWENHFDPQRCALSPRNKHIQNKKTKAFPVDPLSRTATSKNSNNSAGTSSSDFPKRSTKLHGQTLPKIRKRSSMTGTNPEKGHGESSWNFLGTHKSSIFRGCSTFHYKSSIFRGFSTSHYIPSSFGLPPFQENVPKVQWILHWGWCFPFKDFKEKMQSLHYMAQYMPIPQHCSIPTNTATHHKHALVGGHLKSPHSEHAIGDRHHKHVHVES